MNRGLLDNTQRFYLWQNNTLLLNIRTHPGARHDRIVGVHNHCLRIRIAAPAAVEGKANKQLLKFISKMFKVRQTLIEAGPHARSHHLPIR